MNITSTYKVHANKGTERGNCKVCKREAYTKDHVINEEVKSCNNCKIQEIIMGNHAITSCTNAHATTSHTTSVHHVICAGYHSQHHVSVSTVGRFQGGTWG